MEAKQLLTLPEDKFREIVDLEIRDQQEERGNTPEARERRQLLRDPILLDRWYLVLVAIKKHVESQIAARKSDLRKHEMSGSEFLPDGTPVRQWIINYYRWKAGALRFKSGVEDRIMEVRSLKAATESPELAVTKTQLGEALFQVHQLRDAIQHHRDEVSVYDDPSDADRDLWGVLQ